MTHPRTLIRNAITAALTGSTSAGVNVYPTRKTDHLENELPVISVYALSEDSEVVIDPRELERDLRVMIECMVTGDSDVDLAMDNLAEEIEAAMDADYTFGLTCFDSWLAGTDMDSVEESGREVGILEMTYQTRYRSEAFVAPTGDDATTDYERSTVAIDLEGNQATADQTTAAFEQEE